MSYQASLGPMNLWVLYLQTELIHMENIQSKGIPEISKMQNLYSYSTYTVLGTVSILET